MIVVKVINCIFVSKSELLILLVTFSATLRNWHLLFPKLIDLWTEIIKTITIGFDLVLTYGSSRNNADVKMESKN